MSVFSVIREWSDRPFAYGTADCCQFVGAVVEEMTGVNPMHQFRYNNRTEARALIKEFGTLEDAFRQVLGEPVPIYEGVILLVDTKDRRTMAGVAYKGLCVVKTPGVGVTDYPLEAARLAWIL